MSFKSVNEVDKFSFDECQLIKIEKDEAGIMMELEALIVMPNNSQNTNYTMSFAATTMVRLPEGKIEAMYKEGYRRYDANDKLLEEVADTVIDETLYQDMLKSFANGFLYRFTVMDPCHGILGIEVTKDDDLQGIESDIYRVEISFKKAIFTWDRYLNRVSQ